VGLCFTKFFVKTVILNCLRYVLAIFHKTIFRTDRKSAGLTENDWLSVLMSDRLFLSFDTSEIR
jgi:hypothetical protein